jgi:hypothetical protein
MWKIYSVEQRVCILNTFTEYVLRKESTKGVVKNILSQQCRPKEQHTE